ncbi:MAG TPA: type II toxin-antitoxin system prevent-host-death family antitoxin [Stellaceae bacterium]|nr:type II toxin-antitoxin system prevent-host-death family antitoxin [Stellaceae bacterium]
MTHGEIEISATEFKAKCLGLLDRLSKRSLKRVTVTKRGKPVAVLTPPKLAKKKPLPSLFGCMKDRTFIPPGYDLTKPVYEGEWDAEKGILHR